ncbi:MAG: hypothetical protein V1837_00020, partial [Candidatus Woesearchaeota archaeon]
DQFVYSCVKNNCGAQCSTSADCSDGNPYTTDNCLANCLCEHIPIPYCGDGTVNGNEQCELPNTNSNHNCPETTEECSGHKKGTRGSFGNCNSNCMCNNNQFSYQCVAGACGAECSVNADCNDGNPNTLDSCSGDCQCVQEPVCGNDVINPGEECELPSTLHNAYCVQSTQECLGNKLGTRDSFGNCDPNCDCDETPFSYACVKGSCNAQCSSDSDCNDNDSKTADSCLSNCTCQHTPTEFCGNRHVESGEQCEPPNSFNNHFCFQSMITCVEHKLGIRDSYGNCDAQCGCIDDPFTFICVKGICGAQCDNNADCNDQNPHTIDSCTAGCMCTHQQLPFCGNGVVDSGEQCELPNTAGNSFCPQSCSICEGPKQGTRAAFGNCDAFCGCTNTPFTFACSQSCGAVCEDNSDCDDQNPHTTDVCTSNCTCEHRTGQFCGDGQINSGEQCELPSTQFNLYCAETNETCIGHKFATRPGFGDCTSSCQCMPKEFCPGVCIAGKCGAQCSVNAECNDQNPLTNDICTADCMCQHIPIPPTCGDNIVQSGEQCELPSTNNNHFCSQSNSTCQATKLGLRDNFGACNSGCQCGTDDFVFICKEGRCGATCDDDNDCGGASCKSVFEDECCGKELIDFNRNHLIDNLTIQQSCNNTCTDGCSCTDCSVDCSGPAPLIGCVVGVCGAQCAQNSDCAPTDCDHLDRCIGHDYYDFDDTPSICNECGCTQGQCNVVHISYNDSRCIGCRSDNDCNSLDRDYCSGVFVKHDEGRCVDLNCTIQTTVVSNCSALDNNHCSDSSIFHDVHLCSNAACVLNNSILVQNCNDGLFCSGQESCAQAQCLPGTPVNCSSHDINIDTCFFQPDSIDATLDEYSFDSVCNEYHDMCTMPPDDYTDQITHECDIDRCGAECEENEDCATSVCNETFTDFCVENKLFDFNSNEENDSVFVFDSCGNNCSSSCSCSSCAPSCEPPQGELHCVDDLCGATCDDNNDCLPNSCQATFNDSCHGAHLIDFNSNSVKDVFTVSDSCSNNCTGSCACTVCSPDCGAPQPLDHCVAGVCGAQCSTNADCDDGNHRTLDTCDSGCTCKHICEPGYITVDNGIGILICMHSEEFQPNLFLCDQRVLLDDNVAFGPGGPGSPIIERIENYAFEGEKIHWKVLVFDKNGIDKIKDVFMTAGPDQHSLTVEANCKLADLLDKGDQIDDSCNVRILEESITEVPSDDTMAYYDCTFTVESPELMYGNYWLTVAAEDLDGLIGLMPENEYWFLNPTVSLNINGVVDFGVARPGSTVYASTITIGNDAEPDSGLIMNMFISGTDFYDSSHSGAKCPKTNQLLLKNFAYFATNGAYSTAGYPGADVEGYRGIGYGNQIWKAKSIISGLPYPANTPFQPGNILTPGAELSVTLRLQTPEPCNGNFDDGQIFFWGEPI